MQLDFTARETWLHRVNPTMKLAVSAALFIYVLFVHNLNVLIAWTLFLVIVYAVATGHPWKRLLLFSLPFFFIFISTSTSMMLFGEGTTTWLHWGLVHVTKESFYRGIHLGFRALSFAAMGLIFALTTRPVLLFYSLMQQAKLPPQFAYSFMAAMRLIPIVLDEFQTLRYALRVRGTPEQRGIKRWYRLLKAYSVPLLAQSIRRAQRMAVAMEAKGFTNDRERTYYYQVGWSSADLWFLVLIGAGIAAAVMLGWSFPIVDSQDVRQF